VDNAKPKSPCATGRLVRDLLVLLWDARLKKNRRRGKTGNTREVCRQIANFHAQRLTRINSVSSGKAQGDCSGKCRMQCAGKFCINFCEISSAFVWVCSSSSECVCALGPRVCVCASALVLKKSISSLRIFTPRFCVFHLSSSSSVSAQPPACACVRLCVWVRSLLSFFNSLFIFTYSLFWGPPVLLLLPDGGCSFPFWFIAL